MILFKLFRCVFDINNFFSLLGALSELSTSCPENIMLTSRLFEMQHSVNLPNAATGGFLKVLNTYFYIIRKIVSLPCRRTLETSKNVTTKFLKENID